jgi:hypothetical protein
VANLRAFGFVILALILGLIAFLLVGWADQSMSTMGVGLYPAILFGALSIPFIIGTIAFSWLAFRSIKNGKANNS